ncbi:MAG: hypothetical protein KAI47_05345 [Deltaproteobacteria bacterium]|nr:hypothetical protein [Deltaproteobacteria bacterium]
MFASLVVAVAVAAGCADQKASGADRGAPAGAVFSAPQGVAASDRWILVANTAFHFDAAGKPAFGQGFVTVVDRARRQVVATIPTTQRNPQRIAIVGDRAYVVNSGIVEFVAGGVATVREGGGIDILALDGSGPPRSVLHNIPLPTSDTDARVGAYGSIAVAPDGRTAFLGSGTRGDVFVVDLKTRRVLRGPKDPLALFPTPPGENDLTTVRWLGSKLAVLDFNHDVLCLSDDVKGFLARRRCVDIGKDPQLIEGPIDVARGDDGGYLVAMSLANRLYRVTLRPGSGDVMVEDRFVVGDGVGLDPLAPNRVIVHDRAAYVIGSTHAQLLRVALPTGQGDPRFARFAPRSNPFDLVIPNALSTTKAAKANTSGGLEAWVTLWGSHQLAIVDLSTGAITDTLGPGGDGAEDAGVAIPDGTIPDGTIPDGGCGDAREAIIGIVSVASVHYGPGAGHGQGALPQVIQGGPEGEEGGSTTGVLSLGVGGEIVVGFGDREIVDGPGPDFIVFENAFSTGPYQSFAEPAMVSVSASESTTGDFLTFPCDLTSTHGDAAEKVWAYPGCAGVRPTRINVRTSCVSPTDLQAAGGDAFDLADLGLKRARYVKLRDAGISVLGVDSRGFDLDAVVLIHAAPR